MRANSLEILAITALLVNYVVSDVESHTETANDMSMAASKDEDVVTPLKSAAAKNVTIDVKMDNWMSRMGTMQDTLINVQAIIAKDEDVNEKSCSSASRKSNKRYLICAGSILNRNHVLTSATCLHEATHIRHNIRATLAVVIAPLKPSIQVIAVTHYQIHPQHNSNPYTKEHLKHDVAILKLACRIDMENYHKVDFAVAPMMQTCSEENCIVAVYRKTGRTSNVMFQMLAPDVPLPSRRRKETSTSEDHRRGFRESGRPSTIDGATRLARPKRRLAEPPTFVRKSASGTTLTAVSPKVPTSTTDISTVQPASTTPPDNPESGTGETTLHDEVSRALRGLTDSGKKTAKSFVVRSSAKYRSCGQSGAPIMLNNTQTAVLAVTCDPRQASSHWFYSDLFDNLEWIQNVLQEWGPTSGGPGGPGRARLPTTSAGNYSGCSTCIFNFFIEIGCKDKNQCGKNVTGHHGAHPGIQGAPRPDGGALRKSPGCSAGNSVGIEIGVGQGCEKIGKESAGRSEYGGKMAKAIDAKTKHLPAAAAPADDAQLRQPVTGRPVKSPLADYTRDTAKYPGKDNFRASRRHKAPVGGNSHRETRVSNDIGLQNIEGESGDWIGEVDKGLEIGTAVKRELAKSRPPNVR